MTNEQKYKTAEERAKAFKKFCDNTQCSQCPYKGESRLVCPMYWLADEYKEPEQDLPFKVDVLDVVATDGKQTIAGCCDKYNAKSLCNRLNAAALAWHKRMMEKENTK